MCKALFFVVAMASGAAHAASAAQLLGEPVQNERGARAGTVSDFIVDVEAGRVLYVVLNQGGESKTLPVRALGEEGGLDMSEAGEIVRPDAVEDARFRRASKLLGQAVKHPHPGERQRVGTIRDIEFDPSSGRVEQVILATPEGQFGVGANVLAHGRFPPLDGPRRQYGDPQALGERGLLRREPSDDRLRLQNPAR